MDNLEHKKYPIGKFQEPKKITDQDIDSHIRTIKDFPSKLKHVVENWNADQLDTQYREGGWTIRQLINHLSDSSMNSYMRFKLALTEDNPTIKSYDEQQWAELQDSFTIDVKPAFQMLKGIHKRWVYELKSLTNKEYESTYHHPDQNKDITLKESLAFCAWHCDHHFAHIQNLKTENNW
ncbi:putative metal-dependent hydrolase [Kaistella flava (ex Peng et al. 2021)]|uniref:Putative metal-dependent hydrolase n=1 Tax=Kaistella flava (ex Peng et al. 2021) TaxID=2038776 RepID=A0A7M2Y6W8_9FLAO|nr:putative metal-dependent hydrolase [Kaistella flava (ex Peng et al. 2021)]QOW09375.1 putative metal-dependent hydrolase [Kaistella flava (ex Peng et al. 2021)]